MAKFWLVLRQAMIAGYARMSSMDEGEMSGWRINIMSSWHGCIGLVDGVGLVRQPPPRLVSACLFRYHVALHVYQLYTQSHVGNVSSVNCSMPIGLSLEMGSLK